MFVNAMIRVFSFVIVSAVFWVDIFEAMEACKKKNYGVLSICAMNLIFLVCKVGEKGI